MNLVTLHIQKLLPGLCVCVCVYVHTCATAKKAYTWLIQCLVNVGNVFAFYKDSVAFTKYHKQLVNAFTSQASFNKNCLLNFRSSFLLGPSL